MISKVIGYKLYVYHLKPCQACQNKVAFNWRLSSRVSLVVYVCAVWIRQSVNSGVTHIAISIHISACL